MKRIAFVDDEEILRDSALAALPPRGFDIVVFPTGHECVAAVTGAPQPPFDCFVIDYDLADIDGPSLYAQLQQISPPTPVVFISGYPQEHVADDIQADVAFLKKPFHFSVLADAIDGAIRRSGETEATR